VRGYVATTDYDWFTFLRARQPLDEVNFWQPSAHGFNAPAGTPFFFKLKAPHNAIGGFGIFARYEPATARLAWDAFGEKNGAPTFAAMANRVGRYARETGGPAHRIGCIMVAMPVFFADAAGSVNQVTGGPTSCRVPVTISNTARDGESGRSAWRVRVGQRRFPTSRLRASPMDLDTGSHSSSTHDLARRRSALR
jgi:hypothetical protein